MLSKLLQQKLHTRIIKGPDAGVAKTDLGSIKGVTEGGNPREDLLHSFIERLHSVVAHLEEKSPFDSCKGGGTGGQASNAISQDWVGGDAYQTLHHNSIGWLSLMNISTC